MAGKATSLPITVNRAYGARRSATAGARVEVEAIPIGDWWRSGSWQPIRAAETWTPGLIPRCIPRDTDGILVHRRRGS